MSEFKTVFDVLENYAYDLSKHVTKNGDEKDESAINQSIENILLTNFGERVFKPNFGSNLLATLFEAGTSGKIASVFSSILSQIQQYEPRVTINVSASNIFFDDINNKMFITIKYNINKTGLEGSLNKKVTL
tara:strand:+ start:870 stop:1265 length:396 start_codon:yes stop_codon:yes gene_type:complete